MCQWLWLFVRPSGLTSRSTRPAAAHSSFRGAVFSERWIRYQRPVPAAIGEFYRQASIKPIVCHHALGRMFRDRSTRLVNVWRAVHRRMKRLNYLCRLTVTIMKRILFASPSQAKKLSGYVGRLKDAAWRPYTMQIKMRQSFGDLQHA